MESSRSELRLRLKRDIYERHVFSCLRRDYLALGSHHDRSEFGAVQYCRKLARVVRAAIGRQSEGCGADLATADIPVQVDGAV